MQLQAIQETILILYIPLLQNRKERWQETKSKLEW